MRTYLRAIATHPLTRFGAVFGVLLAAEAGALAAFGQLPTWGIVITPARAASVTLAAPTTLTAIPTGEIIFTDEMHHFVVPLADRTTWWRAATRWEVAGLAVTAAGEPDVPGGVPLITLDPAAIQSFIARELVPLTTTQPGAATITTDDAGHVTFDGVYAAGQTLDEDILLDRITRALREGTREIELPYRTMPGTLTIDPALIEQGIREVIGETVMDYSGSPAERAHNVAAGADKLNGMRIAPGQVWSYNDAIFPLSAVDFTEAHAIVGGKMVDELGGGICQTSSAMYRAALDAGLPIAQHSPHSLLIEYYRPPGLDAAVYPGVKDLKFKNDTGHPILIQAVTTDDQRIRVTLYGTRDGRHAEMRGPFAPDGSTTIAPGARSFLWTRELTRPDGSKTTETYRANYRG